MIAKPRLLVSVGTDFHPFDRAIGWVDSWLGKNPEMAARTLVQHGTSSPSKHAVNADLLSYSELQTAMEDAELVLSHGGPATIFEARKRGHLPLCIARNPMLGEHVDNHQEVFVEYLGNAGLVQPVASEEHLHQYLDDHLNTTSANRKRKGDARPPAGIEGMAQTIRELIVTDTRPGGWRGQLRAARKLSKVRGERRRDGQPTLLPKERLGTAELHVQLPVIAYVIVSHQPDGRLERLVGRIRQLDPDARIHVNHNPTGVRAITPAVRENADSVVLTPGGRGDSTHIDRQLHSSRLALEDPKVDFVIVISGEDYPCADLVSARRDLLDAKDGFLNHRKAFGDDSPWPQREPFTRYYYKWRTLRRHSARWASLLRPLHAINYMQPWIRFNTVYGALRLGWRGNTPPVGLTLYAGTAWSCLSRRAIEIIDAVLTKGSEVERWASKTLVADEVLIPSVILSAQQLSVQNERKFFVDFTGTQHGRPVYLTAEHLPQVLNSGAWFCRKVRSKEFMDALDQALN